MPAAPKSPRSKKPASIAKPKGAVRAKSGCYTCRIRRKKCDEKRMGNDDGPCETCLRLKLECLGFGAKRPEWLRETSRVSEIRDRIKAHLAAQGMIKGHAGSGSRNAVQEDILRLSDYREGGGHDLTYPSPGSSSSASTPRRDDSVESDRPYPTGRLMLTSAMRGMYDHHDQYPVHSDIPSRSDSPCDTAMHSSVHDYDSRDYYSFNPRFDTVETPAKKSSFSRKGLYEYTGELYTIDDGGEPPFGTVPTGAEAVTHYYPSEHVTFDIINDSLRNYVDNVVKIQYLLGDRNILPTMIWEAIKNHTDSHEAVSLLSKAYYGRQENPYLPVLQDFEVTVTIRSLKGSLSSKGKARFTADDAMTALHVVSLYLFDGGRGKWNDFLSLAVMYVEHILENPAYFNNYSAALEAASPKDEFVVKTTIWFDVLASITTQEPPRLLMYIRELFKPDLSWIGRPPSYSMMSPMGCENIVVWALAETSYLSYWKRRHEQTGALSVPELVRKVADIEQHLRPGPRPERPQTTPENWSRYLASEIFRTATRLFLKTVESGDFPHVPEIKDAVSDTFNAILDFPISLESAYPESRGAIVRSTVFGIFICGSLTNDPNQRRMLTLHLEQNTGHEGAGVGNCPTTSNLLQELWTKPQYPVPWRQLLKGAEILLV